MSGYDGKKPETKKEFIKLLATAKKEEIKLRRSRRSRSIKPTIKGTAEVWGDPTGSFTPNAWLRIAGNGQVTVRINHSEMGQGVTTGLAMIIAEGLEAAQSVLAELAGVLGLRLAVERGETQEVAPLIELLIEVRERLRQDKQWELADWLRDRLGALGITLEDGKGGTTWRTR